MFRIGEILLVMAFASVVMISCLGEEDKGPELVTINVTHVVRPNEVTVHDVARRYIAHHKGPQGYERFVLTIRHINGMLEKPRALRTGERLIIPIVVEAH